MFKTILMASAASMLLAGAATAADLPSRRAPPVYIPPPVPVFTWTGFYAGINAGYGFSSRDTEGTTACGGTALCTIVAQGQLNSGTVPTSHQLSEKGFMGGGQIGYNYEFGAGPTGGVVIGVEADIDYSDLRHNDVLTDPTTSTTNTYHSRLSYLGTARGRIGYAFDRFLVYGTGGFAYGETSYSHSFDSNTTPAFPIFSGARSGTQTGYAVGGGVEYALPSTFSVLGSGAVTIRAEYLYYDLGTRSTTLNFIPAALPVTLTDRVHTAGNLVRAGLNFKFGDPAPVPVVARY